MRCSHFSLGGYSRANPSVFRGRRGRAMQDSKGKARELSSWESDLKRREAVGVFALHFHFELLVDV